MAKCIVLCLHVKIYMKAQKPCCHELSLFRAHLYPLLHHNGLRSIVMATSVPLMVLQGQSFAIGGDSDAQTIATFLRFYTPNITGASLGHHLSEVHVSCNIHYDLLHLRPLTVYRPEFRVMREFS